jgi:predicted unusual protein kinase regulating ubiquinone biosynthesis (AarF/ABC1/UbiB family)
MRAFSTLEGVGKGLDPEFNFMEVAKPFAMQIMTNGNGSEGNSFLNELGRQAAQVSSTALGLPRRLEDTLEKLERGDLRVRVRSIETERLLRRQSSMQLVTTYAVILSAFILSATILFVNHYGWLALVSVAIASTVAVALCRLILRLDRYERMY